jgi:hypothetical protein
MAGRRPLGRAHANVVRHLGRLGPGSHAWTERKTLVEGVQYVSPVSMGIGSHAGRADGVVSARRSSAPWTTPASLAWMRRGNVVVSPSVKPVSDVQSRAQPSVSRANANSVASRRRRQSRRDTRRRGDRRAVLYPKADRSDRHSRECGRPHLCRRLGAPGTRTSTPWSSTCHSARWPGSTAARAGSGEHER